ncbi:MAG: sigma-54-dependent Fis family transcriptional regulator [Ignavibacteria bacterium]|nr:sigma-54-dependent Fis family transcriptional regulator [Ignavibacteria bacterium]
MTKPFQILVVDDDESITFLLQTEFEQYPEFQIDIAQNGTEAINLLQSKIYDVALLDIKMPRVSGIDVLKFINESSPSTQPIMLTSVVDVRTAFEVSKYGAYDYVTKPYDVDELIATVRRAVERRQLLMDKEALKIERLRRGRDLVGKTPIFREVVANAKKVAASDAFVLVQGPSGTGKELIAYLIHQESPRRDRPFVPVNCASIPDQLLESELFGHEKGAFTNAYSAKQGLVEVANGGTLFLDEVGDISPATQPKLLRFLETGEFRRVGGTSSMKVDVRVVSATNKNLLAEVREGRFREDLYYRLNIVTIAVPSLRERKADIPHLAEHFLNLKSKAQKKRLSPSALAVLMSYHWPGNVRELEHVIEGAIALAHGDTIEAEDLWVNASLSGKEKPGEPVEVRHQSPVTNPPTGDSLCSLEELEMKHIMKILEHNEWNRARSAEMLGITPKTLYLKIKKYGLKEN